MPLPPSRDPTPSVVSPNSTRSRRANVERAPRLKLFMDGEKGGSGLKSTGRKNRIRSIIVPGEVMPPFDAASPSPSAGSESEAEHPPAPVPKPSTPAPRRRKFSDEGHESNSDNIKLNQYGRKKSSPKKTSQKTKIPKSRPRGMVGTNVHSTVAGISVSNAMAALTPPPQGPQPGSEWAPWLELTQWELHMVRRTMKKNANWEPSDTMKNRELVKKGRGLENFKKAQTAAKSKGEKVVHQPAHHSERVAAAIEATEKLRDQVAMETGDVGEAEMQDAEPVSAPELATDIASDHALEPETEPPPAPAPAPEPLLETAPETEPAAKQPMPGTVKNKGMVLNEKKKKKRDKGNKDKVFREQEAQERMRMEEASRKINDAGKSVAEFDFGSSLITLPPREAALKSKKRKRNSQAQKGKSTESHTASGEKSLSLAEPKTPASAEPVPKKLKLNPPAPLAAAAAPPGSAPASAVSPKTTNTTSNYVPIAPAGPVESVPPPKKSKKKSSAAPHPGPAKIPSQITKVPKASLPPAFAETGPAPAEQGRDVTEGHTPAEDTANDLPPATTPSHVETPATKQSLRKKDTTNNSTNKNNPHPTRQTRNSLSLKLTNKKAASAEPTPTAAPTSATTAPTSRDRRSSLRRASAASLATQQNVAAASTPVSASASRLAQQTPGTAAGRRERRSTAAVPAAATATPVDKSGAGTGKGTWVDKLKSKSTPAPTTVVRKKSSVGSASGGTGAVFARRKSSSKGTIRLPGNGKQQGQEQGGEEEDERWCLCGDVSHGTMVECDGGCVEQWFHVGCVGIDDLPARTKKWFCPSCRKRLGVGVTGVRG